MEDFIEIIILVLVSVAGIVQGLVSENKKKKKKTSVEQLTEESIQHSGERRVPGNWQILSNDVYRETAMADDTNAVRPIVIDTRNNTRPRIEVRDDIMTIEEKTEDIYTVTSPLLNDFDLKKAILYSEILKPKF